MGRSSPAARVREAAFADQLTTKHMEPPICARSAVGRTR
jgi:hypothetical protein